MASSEFEGDESFSVEEFLDGAKIAQGTSGSTDTDCLTRGSSGGNSGSLVSSQEFEVLIGSSSPQTCWVKPGHGARRG